MIGNNYLLWENESFVVKTPFNPHIPYNDGLHLVVAPKEDVESAWGDVDLSTEGFRLAAKACKIMEGNSLAPWFNIQANGNWGLLPGATPFFHIHVYGRNKTDTWGKPIVLPEAPKTYNNDPMPEKDREFLTQTFTDAL
jgi:diadenosine tetraphosphate (Ap4A) HIT family hydrolase